MSWSGAVSRISPTRFTIRTRSARACWQEWRSKPALSPGISDAVDASDEQRSAGRRRRGNGRPGGWDEKGADQGETWRFLGGLFHFASAGRQRNAIPALPAAVGTESLLPFDGLLFGVQEPRRLICQLGRMGGRDGEIRRHHTLVVTRSEMRKAKRMAILWPRMRFRDRSVATPYFGMVRRRSRRLRGRVQSRLTSIEGPLRVKGFPDLRGGGRRGNRSG